jgi:hypothetical protein
MRCEEWHGNRRQDFGQRHCTLNYRTRAIPRVDQDTRPCTLLRQNIEFHLESGAPNLESVHLWTPAVDEDFLDGISPYQNSHGPYLGGAA